MPAFQRPLCIACGQATLILRACLSLDGHPHGHDTHQFIYGQELLGQCPSCHALVIEEFDHDCFSYDDPWHMYWWSVITDEKEVKDVLHVIASCGASTDTPCDCPIHEALADKRQRNTRPRAAYGPSQASTVQHIKADMDEHGVLRLVSSGTTQPSVG